MNDTALRHFLDDYCATFRPGNIAAIARRYHLPVTMMVGEQISTLNSEQQIVDMLEAIMRFLFSTKNGRHGAGATGRYLYGGQQRRRLQDCCAGGPRRRACDQKLAGRRVWIGHFQQHLQQTVR